MITRIQIAKLAICREDLQHVIRVKDFSIDHGPMPDLMFNDPTDRLCNLTDGSVSIKQEHGMFLVS
jgi:hypothetical protein